MIWTIVKREMLEYIKSSKFLIGLGITVILITISTIINIQDYKQRNQDYLDAARQKTERDVFAVQVYRPPQVLSILVQGYDRKLGNRIELTYLRIPFRTSGYMGESSSQHHRYLAGFSAVDFAFVVRVVLSLMVIFLAYNAISEEKTHGTLKLMLANRLPRDQLLLGKFIGGLLVVMASLVISIIVSLLIILFDPVISLAGSDWARILGLLGISALYLICFYTLSLFISVVVSRPSIALLVLLQLWIFLVIIYPNLSVLIAENLYNLPSEQEIEQSKNAAFQPYEQEFKKVIEAFHNAAGRGVSKELGMRNVELWSLRAEKNYQVDQEFGNRLSYQMNLAQTISILSPAVVYDLVENRLARTGMAEFERFMDGVYRHWQKLIEWQKLRWRDREAYKKFKLPDFTYPSETTAHSFIATWPQWVILFLFSLIFFALAYTAFLKKDVR
jgi:ABC-type transport system involved in multi-copper enzyme maturation permease subunit